MSLVALAIAPCSAQAQNCVPPAAFAFKPDEVVLQSTPITWTPNSPKCPENWLRGQFNLTCAKGVIGVFYTLAPTQPPLIQHLEFRKLETDKVRMVAPSGPPVGVACAE